MKTLLTILLLSFFAKKTSAQPNTGVIGKIVTENTNELLKIKATVTNTSEVYHNLSYILVSVKKGKSGNSSNKQSGKFNIQPSENKLVSESTIRIAKKDALKVFLFIKDEESDKVISKDSLELNPNDFNTNVSYIPEADLELSGLTVDDTKTRVGQAFYDLFFRKYNLFGRKFSGTITISELPSVGRGTRIMISQNDQMIYAFQSKPDDEYLEAECDKTLALLLEFEKRNRLKNREFKY